MTTERDSASESLLNFKALPSKRLAQQILEALPRQFTDRRKTRLSIQHSCRFERAERRIEQQWPKKTREQGEQTLTMTAASLLERLVR
jgi:hypothetical protein